MQTLIQPKLKLKLKIDSFDNSNFQVKGKSNSIEFGLDLKFYQKLFILFFE